MVPAVDTAPSSRRPDVVAARSAACRALGRCPRPLGQEEDDEDCKRIDTVAGIELTRETI
jgi:hypothetical protein